MTFKALGFFLALTIFVMVAWAAHDGAELLALYGAFIDGLLLIFLTQVEDHKLGQNRRE